MILEALERELPPATLLVGPDVESLLYAAHRAVTRKHGVARADTLVRRHVSAADARGIVKAVQFAPFGPLKVILAVLDGSTPQAQNILLKVVEEPPACARLILVASSRPLATICSRCQVITVPGDGARPEADAKTTGAVSAALAAAAAGDLRGLEQALSGWGDDHHAVLTGVLADAAAGDRSDMDAGLARKLLGLLGRHDHAHPRLAAHAALAAAFSDRERYG